MTDSASVAAILQKTNSFSLDATVKSLEAIVSGGSSASYTALPLGTHGTIPHREDASDKDRPFLETSFNKISDGEYRSPWKTNPSNDTEVVELEASANEVWDAYRQLYYGPDAVGSVFVRRKGDVGGNASSNTPAKKKKVRAMEALFAIRKSVTGESFCDDGSLTEIARWESVHRVVIEAPNLDSKTCEYQIQSSIWCFYQPEDVGDVPKAQKKTPPQAVPKPQAKKKASKALDIARLEMFDRAADNWDSRHSKEKTKKTAAAFLRRPPSPPIPAVVTSSAFYSVDTTKKCPIVVSSKSSTIASQHIVNIGQILEKVETDHRSKLERVDAPKCVEILQTMYRPSLSPGLKLGGTQMVSKLGGHATGMGVGKSLIGEIALKAQSKGLGTNSNDDSEGGTNDTMESVLAAGKKKLVVENSAFKTGFKKAGASPTRSPVPTVGQMATLRAGLKTVNPGIVGGAPLTGAPTPEFMNFRNKLKPTTAK